MKRKSSLTLMNTVRNAIMGSPARLLSAVRSKYQWRVENKEYLAKSRITFRLGSIALVLIVLGTYAFPGASSATVHTWTQSNWSGGVGNSTTNQYSSATGMDTSASNAIKLTNTEELGNNSFDSNLTNWTTDNSEVVPGIVQTASALNLTATSFPATFPSPPQANDTLVLTISVRSNPGTITLAGWTQDASVTNSSTAGRTIIYRKVAGSSESSTVTLTTQNSVVASMNVFELTGVDTVSPLDQTTSVQGAATQSTTVALPATGTTAQSDEIAIGAVGFDSSSNVQVSWSNGFTNALAGTSTSFAGTLAMTSKQSISTTFTGTTARTYHGVLVTYKGAHTSQSNAALPAVLQGIRTFSASVSTMTASYTATPGIGNTLFAILSLSTGFTATPPSGWNVVTTLQSNTGSTTILYSKIAGSSEPTDVTINFSGSTNPSLNLYEVRGLVSGTSLDKLVTFINNASDPLAFSTAVTSQNIELALGANGTNTNSGVPSNWESSGFTRIAGAGTPTMQSGFKYLNTAQAVSVSLTNTSLRVSQGFLATYKAGADYVTATRDTATTHSGAGAAKLVASPWATARLTQSINTGDTNNYSVVAYVRTDGSTVTSSDASLYYNGSTISTTYTSAGSGWYKLTGTVTSANAARDIGVEVPANKTVYVDDFSMNRFQSTGTLTSNIYDTGQMSNWGVLNYSSSGTGTVTVRARTSNLANMSDAPNFNTCAGITSATDISTGTNGCVTDAQRYVQYQVTLAGDTTTTPTFTSISIDYSGSDVTAPTTNASAISMYASNGGSNISSNGWTKGSLPYFSWTPGIDNTGGVGVAGYCVYLGTDSNADPATTKGMLGTGSLDTESSCPFATADTSLDLATSGVLATALTTSDTPYYFLVKAIDSNHNIYSGSAASFHFRFDNTAPTNPAYIIAPSSFISTKTATLTWPTSTGDAPADANSGVAGLQYKIGAGGTWYGDNHTGSQDATDLLDNDGSYITQSNPDFANLIEGSNVIYFRTYDQAGNVSIATVTTVLKINTAGAPSAPQNITATPSTNTHNSFAFSWIAPATYVGSASNLTYCYTINALPTSQNCTFTSAGQLSVPAGAFATQPGSNTFYVVAKDESGSVNYATAGSVEFTANTSAPGIALNPDIADTSVRSTENWRLVVSWESPADTGAGIANYDVYRSTDGTNYLKAGSTSGSSYVDTGLDSIQYFYKIRACDSANNCGAFSEAVDKTPTGRYTTPPVLTTDGGVPHVDDVQTRSAKMTWSTDRNADSKVAYGIVSGQYGSTEAYNSKQTTDHSVQLDNLSPGTTYYFVVRWTDTDGNTGTSTELTFATLPPPSVQDVSATGIGLTTATLQYTTSGASGVKIYYGKTDAFGAVINANTSSDTSTYLAQLKDLEDGTKYFYKINPLDINGFEYEGTTITFQTPAAPHITNVRFQPVENEPSSTQLVTWDTNVAATSELSYGVVGGDTLTALDNTMTTAHQVTISQLIDDSLYSLTAKSRDGNGNLAVSDIQSFHTELDTRPPTISEIGIVPSIRGTGADARGQIIVSWKTDEPATSQVAYGEGATGDLNNSSTQDSRLTLDHAVVISDLSTSKVYRIQPISFDKANNKATGDAQTAIIGRGTQSALAIIFGILQKIFGVQA